jgi:DNA-directed RNA polymerase specialized sigma24 family protein
MLIDDVRTRELLSRIVYRLSSDPSIRDDLMQEALVHLWLLEERRPGQRQSWYLQSCKFHLQNFLVAGRSVDSPKRRAGKIAYSDGGGESLFAADADNDNAVFGQVSARDILSLLCGRLTPFEQSILTHLAEGLGAREIAERMDVTHPTVIKYRRKIASLAIRLGIPPLPKYARHGALAMSR